MNNQLYFLNTFKNDWIICNDLCLLFSLYTKIRGFICIVCCVMADFAWHVYFGGRRQVVSAYVTSSNSARCVNVTADSTCCVSVPHPNLLTCLIQPLGLLCKVCYCLAHCLHPPLTSWATSMDRATNSTTRTSRQVCKSGKEGHCYDFRERDYEQLRCGFARPSSIQQIWIWLCLDRSLVYSLWKLHRPELQVRWNTTEPTYSKTK